MRLEHPRFAAQTLSIACLALLTMSGCVTTPPGYVAREWSKTMRELGITPVFPPREDVQVGDIYLAPTVPEAEQAALDSKGYIPLGLWVGAAKISDAATKFYSERSSFPATSKTGLDQPRTTSDNVFTDADKQRLRLVGFPIFMSTSLSQGSLSGVIPTEAVGIAASAGFTDGRRVTVSVPRAESYALPAAVIFDRITAGASDGDNAKKWNAATAGGFDPKDIDVYLPSEQRAILSKDPSWQKNKFGYVRVITEVYFARELDISIESSRGVGLSLDAKPAASLSATQQSTGADGSSPNSDIPASTSTGSQNTSTAGTETPPIQFQQPTPQQVASELNRQLDAGMQRGVPGVGARFVSAGSNGVGLRVTFERPIAIGYRGMLLRVSQDRTVAGAGAIDSVVPTAAPQSSRPDGATQK